VRHSYLPAASGLSCDMTVRWNTANSPLRTGLARVVLMPNGR